MPTINISLKDVERVLGRKFTQEELEEALPWIVLDIEDMDDDSIKVEYNPNRPDYCSSRGVLRALAGSLKIETGLIKYKTKKGKRKFIVEDTVKGVRPYIVGAVIYGMSLTSDNIIELMSMQEDLHWAIGRDRKKVAIGLHDLDKVESPFTYKGVDPEEYRFVPLQGSSEMSLGDILKDHPKGQKYAHLLTDKKKYPLIVDAKNEVISFPPIINGVLTQVTENTKNFLFDITGPDHKAINDALNIITTSLADEGAIIETVDIIYKTKTEEVPTLNPKMKTLSIQKTNSLLGLELSAKEIIQSLNKVRMDASSSDKDTLQVKIPAYRIDILHEIDLIEEVAVGYGINNLEPTIPQVVTVGKSNEKVDFANLIREILIGCGYLDLLTFALVNKEDEIVKKTIPAEDLTIELRNPVSQEFNTIRTSILPSIFGVISRNRHADLPIRIFEVGDTVIKSKESRTRTMRRSTLGAASIHKNTGFTEMKSLLTTVLHELRIPENAWSVKPISNDLLIPGRGAMIFVNNKERGILGEIHPQILNNYQIEFPLSVLELQLDQLKE
ncbi:MAG: phenylalanine--tRNA ligase subunit beta [Candidatus Ranarchaeia archaeon]